MLLCTSIKRLELYKIRKPIVNIATLLSALSTKNVHLLLTTVAIIIVNCSEYSYAILTFHFICRTSDEINKYFCSVFDSSRACNNLIENYRNNIYYKDGSCFCFVLPMVNDLMVLFLASNHMGQMLMKSTLRC